MSNSHSSKIQSTGFRFGISAFFYAVLLLLLFTGCSNRSPYGLKDREPSFSGEKELVLDFSGKRELSQQNQEFIRWFTPLIIHENSRIMSLRHRILVDKNTFEAGKLSKRERRFLYEVALEYALDEKSFKTDSLMQRDFRILLSHVDIIPTQMALAQAIVESEWGNSRFAAEGNNYFGIHCYTPGCGIAPKEATGFWLESYSSVAEGIEQYLHFMNTKPSMKNVRRIRQSMRAKNQIPTAKKLTHGMHRYAEIGNSYISRINMVIEQYIPDSIPNYYSED